MAQYYIPAPTRTPTIDFAVSKVSLVCIGSYIFYKFPSLLYGDGVSLQINIATLHVTTIGPKHVSFIAMFVIFFF